MDFRILKHKVYYDQYIRLEPENYQKIIEIAEKLDLPLIKRISDYYGDDIRYKPFEYSDLNKEIDQILKVLKDEKTAKLLKELKNITNLAEKDQKSIEVLTD